MNDEQTIDPQVIKEIGTMCERIHELQLLSVQQLTPEVNRIIRDKITDENAIAHLLDSLLDCAACEEGELLFKKLLRYLYPINQRLVASYVDSFQMMYDDNYVDYYVAKLEKNSDNIKVECELIFDVAGIIWREHYTPIIGTEQVEYMLSKSQSPEQIYVDIHENNFTYYGAVDKDSRRLIGYCAVVPKGDYLLLSKLYVHHDFRGKGIARAFLKEVIELCKSEHELSKIHLTVNKNNTDSIAAYKKMRFETVDSVKNDIGSGFYMDDYVMELNIPN